METEHGMAGGAEDPGGEKPDKRKGCGKRRRKRRRIEEKSGDGGQSAKTGRKSAKTLSALPGATFLSHRFAILFDVARVPMARRGKRPRVRETARGGGTPGRRFRGNELGFEKRGRPSQRRSLNGGRRQRAARRFTRRRTAAREKNADMGKFGLFALVLMVAGGFFVYRCSMGSGPSERDFWNKTAQETLFDCMDKLRDGDTASCAKALKTEADFLNDSKADKKQAKIQAKNKAEEIARDAQKLCSPQGWWGKTVILNSGDLSLETGRGLTVYRIAGVGKNGKNCFEMEILAFKDFSWDLVIAPDALPSLPLDEYLKQNSARPMP